VNNVCNLAALCSYGNTTTAVVPKASCGAAPICRAAFAGFGSRNFTNLRRKISHLYLLRRCAEYRGPTTHGGQSRA